MMKRIRFDCYEGKEYFAYELETAYLKATILEYGGIIQRLEEKQSGIDIVQGYETIETYLKDQDTYSGAVIGRYCNRIGNGNFVLNGMVYPLYQNNGKNTLHGGKFGFNQKIFASKIENDTLVLSYISLDGEEGFPGELHLEVRYCLHDNSLDFAYKVHTDADTVFNITNHTYFNLRGYGSIMEHQFRINASRFGLINETGLTTDDTADVEQTPFDFRTGKSLNEALSQDHEQIALANGIDHHFLIDGAGSREFLTCDCDKLKLLVESDLPGFHFYTGNFLLSYEGKKGIKYDKRTGFCIETQFYPDNINNKQTPKSILKAGEIQSFHTKYTVINKEIHDENN